MRILLILALVALVACSETETEAVRTAAAYKVCRDAGLEGREGYTALGALVIYCVPQTGERK